MAADRLDTPAIRVPDPNTNIRQGQRDTSEKSYMQSILPQFLRAGLLTIVEDDEKLDDLEKASNDILAFLLANPRATQRFALAGFDSTVTPDDPVYRKVGEAAEAHWRTIAGRLGQDPRQVYRAIILAALEGFVKQRAEIASVLLLCVANLPTSAFGKGEASAIQAFLKDLEEIERTNLEATWAGPQVVAFPMLTGKQRKAPLPSKDDLLTGLSKAVGTTDLAGNRHADGNPHLPDSPQDWSNFFSAKAADTIYKAITAIQKVTSDESADLLRSTVNTLAEAFNRMALREAKSELLWIKESAYLPAGSKHISDLSDAELSIYSTIDIGRVVGPSRVPSVEWFLYDLVKVNRPVDHGVQNLLEKIRPTLLKLPEAALFQDVPLPVSGRRTLLEVCVAPSADMTFESQTGLSSNFKESLADFSRRIYRELLAAQILTKKA